MRVALLSAAILSMTSPLLGASGRATPSSHPVGRIPVKFVYPDSRAQKVCVMGSFNEWSSGAHCMKREGDGWSVTVFLAPGRYQYMFLIDGNIRQQDPGALLTQDNGFGDANCVLVVE